MKTYQKDFIEFCLQHNVIQFGNFVSHAGRTRPYRFDTGAFNTGATISVVGKYYAAAIRDANMQYDVLYGPAYKGIPLVISASIALFESYQIDKPYCFNRKQVPDEENGLIGSPLQGKVLIVDDLITTGTAVRRSIEKIKKEGGGLSSVVVALNRQEKIRNEFSAIQVIEKEHQTKIISIISFEDIIEYVKTQPEYSQQVDVLENYFQQYKETR